MVLAIGFATYTCKFTDDACSAGAFDIRSVFRLIGLFALPALFIFPLITFPYYRLRFVRRRVSNLSSSSETNAAKDAAGVRRDWHGMIASCALILVVLLLAHFLLQPEP